MEKIKGDFYIHVRAKNKAEYDLKMPLFDMPLKYPVYPVEIMIVVKKDGHADLSVTDRDDYLIYRVTGLIAEELFKLLPKGIYKI